MDRNTSPHAMLVPWDWSTDDQPVELQPFLVQEWKHDGDSRKGEARPHRRRGEAKPPPTYLLKWGRDAIGERVYSAVARHLNMPSTVVRWTTYPDLPEAAIRFEPDAWRPEDISVERGLASLQGRVEFLLNPLDYYRHLALSMVLGEYDGEEFMVRQQVLFRIDAASVGWTLAGKAFDLLGNKAAGKQADPSRRVRDFGRYITSIQQHEPYGEQPFVETLQYLAEWADLPDQVGAEILACPAVRSFILPKKMAQASKVPSRSMIPLIAEVAASYLRQQQQAIKSALGQQW
ncbi:MAG TPA: hypothetical protein VKT82_03290 [Ktedonobacterales bacterium]|nr:hypothetical protein [Ktedonobacterales bacterium]